MNGPDALRAAIASKIVISADGDGHLLESAMAVLDVEILRRGKPILGYVQTRRTIPQNHQSIRIRISERAQQKRIRNAEKRSAGANSNRQRKRYDRDKSGSLPEATECVANVCQ